MLKPAIFNVDDDHCSQQILGEQAEILAQQVRLRTEELGTVIAEFKSTQQQMVQQEKMAMVGQLTAGIAHEINNPIGFISSNIFSLGKYCERLLMLIEAQQEALLSVKPDSHQTEQMKTVRHNLKIERVIRDIPEMIRETMEGVDRIKCIVNALKNFSRIQSYAGMIQQDLEAGKYGRAQDDLKWIESAAAKMTFLINDLLELSQVGIMMNDPASIDMNLLVIDCLAQLAGPQPLWTDFNGHNDA